MIVSQDPWLIAESSFNVDAQQQAEILFTQGNGLITQRGCFEEFNSGNSPKGTFIKGINTPTKVSDLPDWTSIVVRLNAEVIDLCNCEILNYQRILNSKDGVLTRIFELKTPGGNTIKIESVRFLSLSDLELGAIKYSIKSIDFQGNINLSVVLDGSSHEKNSPLTEPEWNVLQSRTQADVAHLWIQTRKTNFQVCEAVSFDFYKNNTPKKVNATKIEKTNVAGYSFGADVAKGEFVTVFKYVAFADSNRFNYRELTKIATQKAQEARRIGWDILFDENKRAWNNKWEKEELNLSGSLDEQQRIIADSFKKMQS